MINLYFLLILSPFLYRLHPLLLPIYSKHETSPFTGPILALSAISIQDNFRSSSHSESTLEMIMMMTMMVHVIIPFSSVSHR